MLAGTSMSHSFFQQFQGLWLQQQCSCYVLYPQSGPVWTRHQTTTWCLSDVSQCSLEYLFWMLGYRPTFGNDNRRCLIQVFLPLSLLVVSICARHLCFGLACSVLESGHLLKHMQLCVRFLCSPFKPARAHLHIGSKVATHVWYFYKWALCNLATMLSGCTKITGLIPSEPTFYQSFHCA